MDFEKHFPGCRVNAMDVHVSADGFVRLVAHRDDADSVWVLSDYAKEIVGSLANTSAGKVESPKKGKKPAAPVADDMDDLDL